MTTNMLVTVAILCSFPSWETATTADENKTAASTVHQMHDAESLLSKFAERWDDAKWEQKFRGQLYMRPADDHGWEVRMKIMASLVAGGAASIPALEKHLTDSNTSTRILAAQTIGFLAPLADIKKLIEVFNSDPDPSVRLYMVDAIGMSGKGSDLDWSSFAKGETNRDVLKHINYAKQRRDQGVADNVKNAFSDFDITTIDAAKMDQQAPDFALESVDGRRFHLSQFRGKQPVVLVFIYGDT